MYCERPRAVACHTLHLCQASSRVSRRPTSKYIHTTRTTRDQQSVPTELASMSFDELFDLTAVVYVKFLMNIL